jgi:hypothetical protein
MYESPMYEMVLVMLYTNCALWFPRDPSLPDIVPSKVHHLYNLLSRGVSL